MRAASIASGVVGLIWLTVVTACQGGSPDSTPNQTGAVLTPVARSTATTAAVQTPSGSIVHTVLAGENLFRIARKYGVTVDELAALNGISDPAQITIGQRLMIPATAPALIPTATIMPPTLAAQPIATSLPIAPVNPIEPGEPTPVPPDNVNGIPIDQFVIMPPAVREHMLQIFAVGKTLGRNPRAFSKVGDSTIENPHFLMRFDVGPYKLAEYASLQTTINYYAGSFARESIAVRRGLHMWSVLNPQWADKDQCEPNEGPLQCEIRLHNPSVMLIRLGANDATSETYFKQSLQKAIDYCLQNGVIPVIGTKSDRHEDPDNTNNRILRELAVSNNLPLWDFDVVADTLPNRGLASGDDTHLSFFFAHDYTRPEAFERGHAVHNLTALIVLQRIMRVLNP